jgi:hypothetical protein
MKPLQLEQPVRLVRHKSNAFGKKDNFRGEQRLLVERLRDFIGNHIVDEVRAHGSDIAKIIDLNGRWSPGEHAEPVVLGESREIDRDIDFQPEYELRDLLFTLVPNADETLKRTLYAVPHLRILIGAK